MSHYAIETQGNGNTLNIHFSRSGKYLKNDFVNDISNLGHAFYHLALRPKIDR